MIIDITTLYDIGNLVYVISKDGAFHREELNMTKWSSVNPIRVNTEDSIMQLAIQKIKIIANTGNPFKVMYRVNGTWYPESHIFSSLHAAKLAIEIKNSKYFKTRTAIKFCKNCGHPTTKDRCIVVGCGSTELTKKTNENVSCQKFGQPNPSELECRECMRVATGYCELCVKHWRSNRKKVRKLK